VSRTERPEGPAAAVAGAAGLLEATRGVGATGAAGGSGPAAAAARGGPEDSPVCGPDQLAAAAARGGPGRDPLRVILALGDPGRERRLLAALRRDAAVGTVARCLDAGQLLARLRAGGADAVVVAHDLHLLGAPELAELAELAGAGLRVVALIEPLVGPAGGGGAGRLSAPAGVTALPVTADADAVRAALRRPAPPGRGGATAAPAATPGGAPAGSAPPAREQPVGGGARAHAPAAPAGGSDAAPGVTVTPVSGAARALPAEAEVNAVWAPAGAPPATSVAVLAVAGAGAGVGCTTVAVSLAYALGAVAPTCLVELAPDPGAAAVLLGLDEAVPGLLLVAHAVRKAVPSAGLGADEATAWAAAPEGAWVRAIEREAQRLEGQSPYGRALCGAPGSAGEPEDSGLSGSRLPDGFVASLLGALRRRFRHVVLDLGPVRPAGPAAGVATRAARAGADHLLLVAGADLLGARRAQAALHALAAEGVGGPERVSLVLNRYDPAFDFERWQIEGVLKAATAAVVPFDHAGARRAARDGRPLVCDGRSRAGRALLDLAERAHGSPLRLAPAERVASPPATATRPVTRASRAPGALLAAGLRRLGVALAAGADPASHGTASPGPGPRPRRGAAP
jgi:septum formation inhibitor-activating ATPase MinD